MSVFKDAEAMYAIMRETFGRVAQSHPEALDPMTKARLTVRFRTVEPGGEFTIDGKTRPSKMTYGPFTGRPDIDLQLTGDNLDKLMRHELSATKAVTNGTIKFKGNPLKLTALLEVLKAASPIYLEVLKERGGKK